MQLERPPQQVFNGTDIMAIFSVPITEPAYLLKAPHKISNELQTITITSTMSVLPVRCLGRAKPKAYTKGARTFAGSMVFTVLNGDPFSEIFCIDGFNSSVFNDNAWHIDQMPPFDIILNAQNETGGYAAQIIEGVYITHWGVTHSVDDMFLEYTYTYLAENVTPFLSSNVGIDIGSLRIERHKTPDDVARSTKSSAFNPKKVVASLPNFQKGTGWVHFKDDELWDDPAIPPQLHGEIEKFNKSGINWRNELDRLI